MTHASNSVAAAVAAGAILSGPSAGSTQAIFDAENRYSNVGTVMVWRVDAAENPVELRGFANGTLIGDRVMLTTLERSEGKPTTIVGYGTTSPREQNAPFDAAEWDARRRVRVSTLRRVVDETWALWAIPSYVCPGDSGGGIFVDPDSRATGAPVLAANVSDGGQDCRRHNNNNRLDTRRIQSWIAEAIRVGGKDR